MKFYFDYAAATPLSPKAYAAMEPYFKDNFYNPSATYLAADEVKKSIENARSSVAGILGVRPNEIIFTAGGTEANNLAIQGVMKQFPDANCIASSVEHESVIAPAGQFNLKLAPVGFDGRVDIDALEKLIDDKTVLVSIMYVNNEIGTIQPLADIAKLIGKIRAMRKSTINKRANSALRPQPLPLYFHTDACQAPNYLKVLPKSLGVDMLTLNAGKIYGPKQCGALFVATGTKLMPLIFGGGQERGLRSGTENPAAIAGFAAALEEASQLQATETSRLSSLQSKAYGLIESGIKGAKINGSKVHRIANNIHVTVPGVDNERLMMELDKLGFMVAAGSACSASSDEPSHVLRAIGLTDKDARSSLRITMGRQTTEADLVALLDALSKLLK